MSIKVSAVIPTELEKSLTQEVKSLALAVGFDVAGVAAARPTSETRFLREWLARGFAGEMHYLGRRAAERTDPRLVLEGARSVVMVGLVYDPASRAEPAPSSAEVTRYAGGDDYHDVLEDRLSALQAAIEVRIEGPVRARAYVDTGPILERVFAAHAGLGWQGKNTCLIHPRLGSYLFLGALLTDLALEPDEREPDHCGSCRACLDACPTDAFAAPYVLDARRCISYTTIEARGPIPEELRSNQGDRLFGCDVCQEVCPWNSRRGRSVPPDPLGLRARLEPRDAWRRPSLAWLLGLDEQAWRAVTRKTALRRSKHRGLMRNALVCAGNSGDRSLRPLIARHAEGEDPLLAEHARWALRRLAEVTPEGT